MKMNCAITVMWPLTKPPCPAPASTAATNKPAMVHSAAKSIRSTDDLIEEFPDQFTGIGRFPGKYMIWLWHDVHPVIHAPRICPIVLCLKVKEHFNKMECLGVITHVEEPTDWASSITYVLKAIGKLCPCLEPQTPMRPSADIITRCPLLRKSLIVCALLLLHQVGYPPWKLVNHSQPGLQLAYDFQQSFQKIPFPVTSIWPHLFPRHLPEEDGSDLQRVPRMHQNSRWHHHPWLHQGRTQYLPTNPHADCLQTWLHV